MEDPLYTNSLGPYRLVMRTLACAYCGSDEETDDALIADLVGIRHCREHRDWASRDCKAYLHEHQRVPVWEIGMHPALGSLAPILDKSLVIKRSNGELQDGWFIRKHDDTYIRCIENEWSLPLINREHNLHKSVPIACFLREDLKTANTSILTSEICVRLHALIDHLKRGLFKADYEARQLVTRRPDNPQEAEGVSFMQSANGPVRVFV
jgi:hypothetical protein